MISLKVKLLVHPQGFLHLSLFILPLLTTFLTVPVLRRGLQKLLRQSPWESSQSAQAIQQVHKDSHMTPLLSPGPVPCTPSQKAAYA